MTNSNYEEQINTAKSLDILIPTRDRPERLTACLSSIIAQEFSMVAGNIRLYLLDNGTTSVLCNNEVVRLLDALSFKGIKSFYMRRPNTEGIFWIRRELYKNSFGDVVCYIDDDIIIGPSILYNLWRGIVDLNINIVSAFVIDVDAFHNKTIAYAGHCFKKTIAWLVRRLHTNKISTIEGNWIEMTEPSGACIMFRRSDFDSIGAWDRMISHFTREPHGWAEDYAICVALKSLGSAFVYIKEIVLHFTPRNRHFNGFQPSKEFRLFLMDNYGGYDPECLTAKHSKANYDISMAVETLNNHEKCACGEEN